MNSDSVEEILVKYSTKIIRTKKDLHHAKVALDKHYASKFIELLPEDFTPAGHEPEACLNHTRYTNACVACQRRKARVETIKEIETSVKELFNV